MLYWGFFYFPLTGLPISWEGTLTLDVCPQQVLGVNYELRQGGRGRGRCSVITVPILYPPLRNFLFKRAGIHVGCGLLSLTLWGDSGQLIIKGGVWNAGEKYHIDWVNSLGVNVGWRIFEVLCGHFSSSHILQKLKCVSGNIHSCLDPLHPRCGQYEKLSMSFEKDVSKEKNCSQKDLHYMSRKSLNLSPINFLTTDEVSTYHDWLSLPRVRSVN